MHKYFMEIKTLTLKKFMLIILASAPLTMILKFINTYVYDDWNFLVSLVILITVDTALGFFKAWRNNTISSKGFGDIITKVFLYCMTLITVHVLMNFTIKGVHPGVVAYVDDFALTSLMLRESISIFENIALINPKLVPPWILKKLKSFDSETGEKIENGTGSK